MRAEGAESCLDGRAVAAAVDARLGRAAFVAPSNAELWLEGVVRPMVDGAGFEVALRIVDASGATLGLREHRAAGPCSAVGEGLPLIVALLIDPEAARRPLAPRPAVPPPTAAAPAPEVEELPRARLHLAVEPVLGVGQMPGPAPGLKLTAWISALPIPLAVSVRPWLGASTPGPGPGARLDLITAALSVCPLGSSKAGLWVCASVDAGVLRAAGERVDTPYVAYFPMVDLALGGRALWPLGSRVSLTASMAAGVRLLRPRLAVLDGAGGAHVVAQPQPFTFETGLGVSVRAW